MANDQPWHEQDRFWEKMAPVLFSEERQRVVAEHLDEIVDLAGILPGASILDLGCGPGRYALALARRGYRVTGVDRTAMYLERPARRPPTRAWMLSSSRPTCASSGVLRPMT